MQLGGYLISNSVHKSYVLLSFFSGVNSLQMIHHTLNSMTYSEMCQTVFLLQLIGKTRDDLTIEQRYETKNSCCVFQKDAPWMFYRNFSTTAPVASNEGGWKCFSSSWSESGAARNMMLAAVQLFRTEQGRPCRPSKSINDNVGYDSQSPRRSSGFLTVSSTKFDVAKK